MSLRPRIASGFLLAGIVSCGTFGVAPAPPDGPGPPDAGATDAPPPVAAEAGPIAAAAADAASGVLCDVPATIRAPCALPELLAATFDGDIFATALGSTWSTDRATLEHASGGNCAPGALRVKVPGNASAPHAYIEKVFSGDVSFAWARFAIRGDLAERHTVGVGCSLDLGGPDGVRQVRLDIEVREPEIDGFSALPARTEPAEHTGVKFGTVLDTSWHVVELAVRHDEEAGALVVQGSLDGAPLPGPSYANMPRRIATVTVRCGVLFVYEGSTANSVHELDDVRVAVCRR